jgi:hypothetical protein
MYLPGPSLQLVASSLNYFQAENIVPIAIGRTDDLFHAMEASRRVGTSWVNPRKTCGEYRPDSYRENR